MKKKFAYLMLLAALISLAGCAESSQTAANPLAGTSWIADNDGSQWVFRDDGSFSWYQDKAVTDDYYYAGDYTVRRGAEAVDYLVEDLAQNEQLKEYAHTREWVEFFIEQSAGINEDYNLDNFLCYSCDNKSYMLAGQEQLSGEWLTAYFGFLTGDADRLEIMNLRTGSYYGFTREEAD